MQLQVALKVIEGKQSGTLIPLNRQKFLIGRDGKVLKRYAPPTKPQDSGIMEDIAAAL